MQIIRRSCLLTTQRARVLLAPPCRTLRPAIYNMASKEAAPQPDAPHSRSEAMSKFLLEHGQSAVKMLVAAGAGLSVVHFGMDPNAANRAENLKTVAQFLSLLWCGASAAIGFIEAPTKFQAPSLTRSAGLDVGRHVFSALNKVEIPAAATLLYVHACGATKGWLPLVPVACVAVETLWLLPALFKRAALIIGGKPVPQSRIHQGAAVTSVVKIGALFALAWALRK